MYTYYSAIPQWTTLLSGILSLLMLELSANQENPSALFRQNWNRLQSQGMCGTPQARVVYAADHPEAEVELDYHPPGTIIHRCDPSAGCCLDRRKQCRPLEESVVTVVFLISRLANTLSSGSRDATGSVLYRSLDFVNHTSCACSNIIDVPR